jgi:hypothetical protein
LHLFSRNAKKYSVSSTSSIENTVSAYSSVNENADSLTVMLVNRDMTNSRTVTINLSNFNVANGNYQTLRLSSLPATETFVSHTQNALQQSTVAVNSNSLTITVPALSTTAILLVKAAPPTVTYVALANRTTGLLMDGLNNFTDGSNAGQWSNSGSNAQQWVLEAAGTYVKIKNRASGLYLDGAGNTTNGAVVKQTISSTSFNQQWQQLPSGSYMKFKNRGTGQYIDGLGLTANPSNLGQWKKSSSSNQEWTVTTLSGAPMVAAEVALTNESKFQIQLNPNPFTSSFSVKVSNPEEITSIKIVDMSGRQVETIGHSAVSKSMLMGASLKPGTYIVQIDGVNTSKSFKVVKIN